MKVKDLIKELQKVSGEFDVELAIYNDYSVTYGPVEVEIKRVYYHLTPNKILLSDI